MATQQIVSSVSTQQKSPLSETVIERLQAHRADGQQVTVVQFPPQTITQTELVLYLSLKGRFQQLEEQLTAAQDDLKARLEAGAVVQSGDHVARLDERSRRAVAWKSVAADLADTVFGEGKGETYCEEVLNSTIPIITVALVVR
jgi:hypothetical protein